MLRNLAEAEAWLIRNTSYGGLAAPRPRRHALEPIATMLQGAGRPQDRYRVVQVVGTRGKGSTAHYLARLLGVQGLRVGLFTSPHLVRLTERIRVDGAEIPGERFAELLWGAAQLPLGPTASFFDLLTALALLHFEAEAVDVAVLEAGRGGATDATSAAGAEAVLFTGLGRDHMDVLGESPEQRALAKAGALRPGATLISGLPLESPGQVVAAGVARLRGSPLLQLGRDWFFQSLEWSPFEQRLVVSFSADKTVLRGRLRSPARIFERNGALALAARHVLLGPGPGSSFAGESSLKSLARAEHDWGGVPLLEPLPGRFEVLRLEPPVVLDGAQSPEAAEAVLKTWAHLFSRVGPPRVLLALGRDKDAEGFLDALARGGVRELVLVQADPYRGREVGPLGELARARGLEAVALEGGLAAWLAHPVGPWLVTGSLYLIGAIHTLAGGPFQT